MTAPNKKRSSIEEALLAYNLGNFQISYLFPLQRRSHPTSLLKKNANTQIIHPIIFLEEYVPPKTEPKEAKVTPKSMVTSTAHATKKSDPNGAHTGQKTSLHPALKPNASLNANFQEQSKQGIDLKDSLLYSMFQSSINDIIEEESREPTIEAKNNNKSHEDDAAFGE